jgi:large subunit ribosomal protein L28
MPPVFMPAFSRANRSMGKPAGPGQREQFRFWSFVMAQVCEICGKGPQFGNNISHAHNVTRRRWNVNLRPVKAKVEGGAKKLRVCTSCIKSGKVVKA